ncbi:hypothetical protein BDZ89DRAFT_1138310 [Hymenopellis radicata]|nr:hypothetical protein BDZ89DRAFT_1138310 [Hymenopellis radicata]
MLSRAISIRVQPAFVLIGDSAMLFAPINALFLNPTYFRAISVRYVLGYVNFPLRLVRAAARFFKIVRISAEFAPEYLGGFFLMHGLEHDSTQFIPSLPPLSLASSTDYDHSSTS